MSRQSGNGEGNGIGEAGGVGPRNGDGDHGLLPGFDRGVGRAAHGEAIHREVDGICGSPSAWRRADHHHGICSRRGHVRSGNRRRQLRCAVYRGRFRFAVKVNDRLSSDEAGAVHRQIERCTTGDVSLPKRR